MEDLAPACPRFIEVARTVAAGEERWRDFRESDSELFAFGLSLCVFGRVGQPATELLLAPWRELAGWTPLQTYALGWATAEALCPELVDRARLNAWLDEKRAAGVL